MWNGHIYSCFSSRRVILGLYYNTVYKFGSLCLVHEYFVTVDVHMHGMSLETLL